MKMQNDGRMKNALRLNGKRTKRHGLLKLTPMLGIVADYVHDRETMQRTLMRADAEMVAQQPASSKRARVKSFIDNDTPVAFLERLSHSVAHFEQYFATDTVELTRICGGLFAKMETDNVRQMYRSYGAGSPDNKGWSVTMLTLSLLATSARLRGRASLFLVFHSQRMSRLC
jgi:hypothetical protein